MATLGQRIKNLRIDKGLTQEQLAQILKTSKSRIGMYEIDKRKPDFEMMEAIADYFNVDMNYLYGRTDVKNQYKQLADIDKSVDLEKLRQGISETTVTLEMIEKLYGTSTVEAFNLYIQLDIEDRAEIRGAMKQLLRSDKYSIQKEFKNA